MIRPLDLQTLFMNLDKIGKEQAVSKEAQAQAQANQVTKLQKEHDQNAHAVKKTNPTGGAEGETSVKVQADGHNPQGQEKPKPRAGSPEAEDGGKKEKQDTAWKDPELGKHVDLSG
jgi:hypothetical protein